MIWVLVALENELDSDYFHQNRPSVEWQLSYTGVGKVNAAISAMKYGNLANCTQIINYGTAGIVSKKDLIGTIVIQTSNWSILASINNITVPIRIKIYTNIFGYF